METRNRIIAINTPIEELIIEAKNKTSIEELHDSTKWDKIFDSEVGIRVAPISDEELILSKTKYKFLKTTSDEYGKLVRYLYAQEFPEKSMTVHGVMSFDKIHFDTWFEKLNEKLAGNWWGKKEVKQMKK